MAAAIALAGVGVGLLSAAFLSRRNVKTFDHAEMSARLNVTLVAAGARPAYLLDENVPLTLPKNVVRVETPRGIFVTHAEDAAKVFTICNEMALGAALGYLFPYQSRADDVVRANTALVEWQAVIPEGKRNRTVQIHSERVPVEVVSTELLHQRAEYYRKALHERFHCIVSFTVNNIPAVPTQMGWHAIYRQIKQTFLYVCPPEHRIHASQFAGNCVLVAADLKHAYRWMEFRRAPFSIAMGRTTDERRGPDGQRTADEWRAAPFVPEFADMMARAADGWLAVTITPEGWVDVTRANSRPFGALTALTYEKLGQETKGTPEWESARRTHDYALGLTCGYIEPGRRQREDGTVNVLWLIHDGARRLLFNEIVSDAPGVQIALDCRLRGFVRALFPVRVTMEKVDTRPGSLHAAFKKYADY